MHFLHRQKEKQWKSVVPRVKLAIPATQINYFTLYFVEYLLNLYRAWNSRNSSTFLSYRGIVLYYLYCYCCVHLIQTNNLAMKYNLFV
jgi:hypothetical protein